MKVKDTISAIICWLSDKNVPRIIWCLFCLHLGIILFTQSPELRGDESRYLAYTENLLKGYFTRIENPELRNGPGYTLVLLPFVGLKIPLVYAKLLNALFLLVALISFDKICRHFNLKRNVRFIFICALGLYPPLLKWSTYLYTETITVMLVCLGTLFFFRLVDKNKPTYFDWVIASLAFGFLALTKVLYGNIYLGALILLLIGWVITRARILGTSAKLMIYSLAWFTPFLVYTYSITGKFFYSGTQGGEILYFRSTPYEGEFGDWFPESEVIGSLENGTSRDGMDLSQLRENHYDFFHSIQGLSFVQRDSAFKTKALEQMSAHPMKYLKNTVASAGRLFFNYPLSYRTQKISTYGYLLPNMLVLVPFVLFLFSSAFGWIQTPQSIKIVLGLAFLHMAAMIVLGGRARHLLGSIPIILLFIAHAVNTLRFNSEHLNRPEVSGH